MNHVEVSCIDTKTSKATKYFSSISSKKLSVETVTGYYDTPRNLEVCHSCYLLDPMVQKSHKLRAARLRLLGDRY
jgi:hypothetical protein